MQSQQLGASLEIVQPLNHNLQISYNSVNLVKNNSKKSESGQNNDDIFELSVDQYSLSFQIQQENNKKINKITEQKKQLFDNFTDNLKSESEVSDKNKLVVIQEQRKRKRRQIFEKYKKPSNQNIQIHLQSSRKTDQLMNTFDQIFSIRSPSNIHKFNQKNSIQDTSANANNFRKKHKQQNPVAFFNKIHLKQHNQPSKQNNQFIDQFSIPSKVSNLAFNQQGTIAINNTDSFLLQQKHKISVIESSPYEQQQISHDLGELQTILQSQIFKDQVINFNNTIQVGDVTYKNFQVSTVNPSIVIDGQNEDEKFSTLKIQSRFDLKPISNIDFNPIDQNNLTLKKNYSGTKLIKIIKLPKKEPSKLILKNKAINHIQNRIPQFLRQVRKRNTVIPNFYLENKNNIVFIQQNEKLKQLLSQFKKSLQFLYYINEDINEALINLNKSKVNLLNSLTLKLFMTSQWQKTYQIPQIQRLRPYENFIKRPYYYNKVNQALINYINVVEFYLKYNLNLSQPKAQKKYFEIRNKFWQIEKNIKMISEDIYSQSLTLGFESHYYEYLRILKGEPIRLPIKQRVQYLRTKLIQYYKLKNSGDLLCMSQIGVKVKQKIQKMICKYVMI